jgi:MarR family 2-MHQ and catechol resistance regulon transcriptional repressor
MTTKAAEPKRHAAQERALKLFIVLSRAFDSVRKRLEEYHDLHEITATEFGILEALYHKGPLLLGDLQKKILLSSGGVTYTVDRLAEKGLVERQDCPSDRRARYAVLTTRGTALMREVFPKHASEIERLLAGLSAREQDDAIALLRKLGLHAAGSER